MSEKVELGVRSMLQSDRPWVISTWLENYRYDSSWPDRIKTEVYFRSHRTVINRLLAQHTCLVAYDQQDSRVLVGFVVGDDYPTATVVQYAYVTAKLRNRGIAKGLMEHLGWVPAKPILVTHWTPSVKKISRERLLVYNPYFAFADFAGALNGKTTRGLEERAERPVVCIGERRDRTKRSGAADGKK